MSAYEIPGFSWSLPADVDWSVKATTGQFRFVDMNTTGEAIAPTANGAAIGVRQNLPKAGEATTIVSSGIVFVEAAEAIAVGEYISTDADGKAKDADTSTWVILGRALTAATAAGQYVTVLLGAHPGVLKVA